MHYAFLLMFFVVGTIFWSVLYALARRERRKGRVMKEPQTNPDVPSDEAFEAIIRDVRSRMSPPPYRGNEEAELAIAKRCWAMALEWAKDERTSRIYPSSPRGSRARASPTTKFVPTGRSTTPSGSSAGASASEESQ